MLFGHCGGVADVKIHIDIYIIEQVTLLEVISDEKLCCPIWNAHSNQFQAGVAMTAIQTVLIWS